MILRKFKIIYNGNLETEIEAFSKYNAKQKFYAKFPRATIVFVKEIEE